MPQGVVVPTALTLALGRLSQEDPELKANAAFTVNHVLEKERWGGVAGVPRLQQPHTCVGEKCSKTKEVGQSLEGC